MRFIPFLVLIGAVLPVAFAATANRIDGTSGDDELIGTPMEDVIFGFSGDDTITGAGRIDRLYGGAGADDLFGGSGPDFLDGGPGADDLHGGLGDDRILGGSGVFEDVLQGQEGNDWLDGGEGDDSLDGGLGDDSLFGGRGRDQLFGSDGNDKLYGGIGPDELFGAEGADKLFGGNGDDRLFGDRGPDVLEGGSGNDLLIGGEGPDRLIGGPGVDTYVGGPGVDTAVFSGKSSSSLKVVRLNFTDYEFSFTEGGVPVTEAVSDDVERLELSDGVFDFSEFSNRPVEGNKPPVAVDDSVVRRVSEFRFDIRIPVLENDSDPDGGVLAVINVTQPELGETMIRGNEIFYDAPGFGTADFSFVDSFQYTIQDGQGGIAVGTITLSFVEQIFGTEDDDTIVLDDGDGVVDLFGLGGDDRLIGSPAGDYIDGGPGMDIIRGGRGDDILIGGGRDDADLIEGNAGNDRIVGVGILRGGTGNDSIFGIGTAILEGGPGDDELSAGRQRQTMIGGPGNDILIGAVNRERFPSGPNNRETAVYFRNLADVEINFLGSIDIYADEPGITRFRSDAMEISFMRDGVPETDFMYEIDFLQFNDGLFQIEKGPSGELELIPIEQ